MKSLDEIKEMRKTLIRRGKSLDSYRNIKRKEILKKNKDMREKYCNPDNIDRSGSILEPDVEVLYDLVKKHNPKIIIEIGTWFGTSAMVMDMSSDGAMIHTCDKHNIMCYGSERVEYSNCTSDAFLSELNHRGIKADMIFVDAGMFRGDDKRISKVMKPEFVFATHDYEKGEKGWKNIRAMQKRFPGVPVKTFDNGSCIAVMEIKR